ncbi:MAG: mannose-1-phosphate guanylyltransferase/mannose-6-phosphate isomerase [Pseudomonadota bacterium]
MKNPTITPVILAGGNGTRLWPLSREATPKQFCALEDGTSLFQKTLQRVDAIGGYGDPIIVCNESHGMIVSRQLDELGINAKAIICEPCGRDTAAAILLGVELYYGKQDELFLVMPSDHIIADINDFNAAVQNAAPEAREDGRLITFGIKPTHPETGFGYMISGPSNGATSCRELSLFVEKPNLEKAEQLVQDENAFWNAGIFLFSRRTVLEEFSKFAPVLMKQVSKAIENGDTQGQFFSPDEASFKMIQPISFDYAIMELTYCGAIMPTNPGWSDMGSWKAVWETSELDDNNNSLSGNVFTSETKNSLVHSNGLTVGISGLEDVVVVADKDAVLVTSRENPQGVKHLVEQMKAEDCGVVKAHNGEDRPWGRFDSLHRGKKHQVKCIRVDPQGQLSLQYHHHRAEHWVVVSGIATVTVDDRVMQMGPCQQVFIPQGAVHRLENMTDEPVEIIEVQYGDYLGEDDIVRLEDVYGRNPTEETSNSRVA